MTGVTYERRRTTLTVAGRVGPGVDRAQVEHRIVNPALAGGSASARPGGLVRAAVGGYSSRLELGGGAFTATYVFDDPAVARLAAHGSGQRILAWQEEDVDDNRQGLTVAELGETGAAVIRAAPRAARHRPARRPGAGRLRGGLGRVTLTWTASEPAITGYGVQLVDSASGAPVGALRETTATTTLTVYNLPAG